MNEIKQVIVIRRDLNMSVGKAIAQGAHASCGVFKHYIMQATAPDKSIRDWIQGSYAKVVVGCDSEEALFKLQSKADAAGIINALSLDEGRTEFKQTCPTCGGTGELCLFDHKELEHDTSCGKCGGTGLLNKPTYTALAIGPDYSDKIDPITKRLRLL